MGCCTPLALMMKAVGTSERSAIFCQATQLDISEDSHFHTCRRETLKADQESSCCPVSITVFCCIWLTFVPLCLAARAFLWNCVTCVGRYQLCEQCEGLSINRNVTDACGASRR